MNWIVPVLYFSAFFLGDRSKQVPDFVRVFRRVDVPQCSLCYACQISSMNTSLSSYTVLHDESSFILFLVRESHSSMAACAAIISVERRTNVFLT